MRINIIGLLITLIISGLVLWAAQQLLTYVPEPPRKVIWVVLVVIVVLYIIQALLGVWFLPIVSVR